MKRTLPLLCGMLVVMAVAYFGYDLLKHSMFPCESIFQQTSAKLGTKLKLLKTEGELYLGSDQLLELSENAQLTAFALKSCCVRAEAGHADPAQYLACERQAGEFVTQLNRVAVEVEKARSASEQDRQNEMAQADAEIRASLAQARHISKRLQQTVEALPKQAAAVAAGSVSSTSEPDAPSAESEPNDDLFNPTPIALGSRIEAGIGQAQDTDHYRFRTAPTYRDIYSIDLQNLTTSMRPRVIVLADNKQVLGGTSDYTPGITPGQDLNYQFSALPDTQYFVRVLSQGGEPGAYHLKIAPQQAYDAFEPNDTILTATPIPLGRRVEVNFMDARDVDHYRIQSPSAETSILVSLENGSTTIRPFFAVYDGNKREIGRTSDYVPGITPGQDLQYQFTASADSRYYLFVDDLANSRGNYLLTVSATDP